MNRYEHVDRTPPMEQTLPADGDGHHEALQAATADQGEAITKLRRRRGRPMGTTVPIERDSQRLEIACWRAFHEMGCGPFDAARRALLVIRGGPITIQDIEGVLHMASARIPLPTPVDPIDPDAGLRRLSAKAKAAKPSVWLYASSGMIEALITFIAANNVTGVAIALDGLHALGWGETIMGLRQRIEAALGSNLPPADLDRLSPAVRGLLAGLKKPGDRKIK